MMGKKLLALLLCGALLVTVLAACGAPEEKDVSAEQDSQPVETEKEPDTGGRLSGQPPESGWYRREGTAGGQLWHQLQ